MTNQFLLLMLQRFRPAIGSHSQRFTEQDLGTKNAAVQKEHGIGAQFNPFSAKHEGVARELLCNEKMVRSGQPTHAIRRADAIIGRLKRDKRVRSNDHVNLDATLSAGRIGCDERVAEFLAIRSALSQPFENGVRVELSDDSG